MPNVTGFSLISYTQNVFLCRDACGGPRTSRPDGCLQDSNLNQGVAAPPAAGVTVVPVSGL
jgi:hypothetical protein